MVCANCGRELVEHRCKVRCPVCGYFEDCSDPGAPGDWTGMEPAGGAARGGGSARADAAPREADAPGTGGPAADAPGRTSP